MPHRGCAIVLMLVAGLTPRVTAQPLPPEPPSAPADTIPPPAAEYSDRAPSPASSSYARPQRISILGDPVHRDTTANDPGFRDPVYRDRVAQEPVRREPVARERPREEVVDRDPPYREPVPRERPRREPAEPIYPALASVPAKPAEEAPASRGATIGRPITEDEAVVPVSAKRLEGSLRKTGAAGRDGGDPVGEFFSRRSSDRKKDVEEKRDLEAGPERDKDRKRNSWKFGDRIRDAADGVMGPQHDWFRSDHAFDCYISPVTNPFLFEDPRSLTEVRPIFMYQKVPSRQADFNGGNITYFGVQARLAITERFSFVINKLGGISVNPDGGSSFDGNTGFAELWLGPKYTFIRNDQSGALMAGGLQFQLPVGNSSVFQNTGNLSLVPYLSYAHPFFRESRVGTLNTMFGTGYAFSTNSARSDYYYLSAHADLNVANWNRFFPLMELNWLIYTTNGNTTPIGSEGRDLVNFGAQAQGVGQLTWAVGGRVKLTESAQIGLAYELPIAGPKDFFDYRFTLDFILRY